MLRKRTERLASRFGRSIRDNKHEKTVTSGPAVTISSQGRLSLNKAALELIDKGKEHRVQLLWDRAEHRVAIEPTAEVSGTLPLQIAAGRNTAAVSGIKFLNYIQYDWSKTRSFEARWDENNLFFVVQLPTNLFGSAPLSRKKIAAEKRGARNAKEVLEGTS